MATENAFDTKHTNNCTKILWGVYLLWKYSNVISKNFVTKMRTVTEARDVSNISEHMKMRLD